MALKRCKSLFFTQNVRIGRAVGGNDATRLSIVDDKRYQAFVEIGIEAQIHDPMRGTIIRHAWHTVRDYELEDDAAGCEKRAAEFREREAKAAEKLAAEKAKAVA